MNKVRVELKTIDTDRLDDMYRLTADERDLIPKLIKQMYALLDRVEDERFRQSLGADLEYCEGLLNRRPLLEELHDVGYAIKPVD